MVFALPGGGASSLSRYASWTWWMRRLEALKGDRRGQHSIRINRQWRICFRWTPDGPEAVEIVDYH
jgi:antitoxin HigA-1